MASSTSSQYDDELNLHMSHRQLKLQQCFLEDGEEFATKCCRCYKQLCLCFVCHCLVTSCNPAQCDLDHHIWNSDNSGLAADSRLGIPHTAWNGRWHGQYLFCSLSWSAWAHFGYLVGLAGNFQIEGIKHRLVLCTTIQVTAISATGRRYGTR